MAAVLSSDWQSGKTLSECFGHVFESSIASDVTFIVGIDKERISAHKLVLFSRSPVFYAMFEGPLAEQGEITIPDISEEIFRMFLRYLYTDTMHLSVETVVPILDVARKYCVDILVSCCEEFLKKKLSVHNSCQFLELAHVFVMDDLKAECLQLIVDSPTVIFQSQSFLDLGSNCLTIITESDDLSAEEIDVYKAVISWAKAECERQKLEKTPSNLHHVLGAILYNVRFPVMDHEFFLKEVCYDKVLPAEDVVQVINYHHHKAGQEEISNSKFNHNNRKYSRREILWRVSDVSHRPWVAGMESVSFTASDCLRLHGFGSYYSHGDNKVDVVIYENDKVVYRADNILRTATDSNEFGEVLLERNGIPILKNVVYTITECTRENRKYFGGAIRRQPLQFKQARITFLKSQIALSKECKGENRSQIPYMILS